MRFRLVGRTRSIAATIVLFGATAVSLFMPATGNAALFGVQITKTADRAAVSNGDRIGYTITVSNPSFLTTIGVIRDTLPATPGTSWSISPAVFGCSISSGVLACVVRLGALQRFSVHITSPTTKNSCGTVTNRATVTTSNLGSATSLPANITVNCPDLIVQSLALTPEADPYQNSWTVTVKNQGLGNADLTGVVAQGVYSPDNSWANQDKGACGATMSGTLAAGATTDFLVHCSSALLASDHYLLVWIDSSNALPETNENNNIGSLPLQDLTVQSVVRTPQGDPYQNSWTVAVKNLGPASADLTNVTAQGAYSPDTSWAHEDEFACGAKMTGGTLAAGATTDFLVYCSAAPLASDNYLLVWIDYNDVLPETNENNNIGSDSLSPPDLIVQSIALTPEGDPYQNSWTVTVKNQGLGNADLTNVAAQGVYSPDTLWADQDKGACGATMSGTLLAGASTDFLVHCSSVPLSTDNYLLVWIDSSNALVESNENNNIGNVALPAPQLPDLIIESISLTPMSNPYDYTVHVKNQGNAAADLTGVSAQGYYGTDATTWPTNFPGCSRGFTAGTTLAAGATIDLFVSCSIGPGTNDHLVVKIDSGDVLAESNENNNIGSYFFAF